MVLLMGALLAVLLLVGPASLTGQPLLIVVGVALGAAILVVTRRGHAPGDPSPTAGPTAPDTRTRTRRD